MTTNTLRVPINIPDIGSETDEIRFVSWLISNGSQVAIDDDLFEVETDKAVFVAGAESAGTASQLENIAQGTVVKVGQTVGWIETINSKDK